MEGTMINFTDDFDELLVEVLLSAGESGSSTSRGGKPC